MKKTRKFAVITIGLLSYAVSAQGGDSNDTNSFTHGVTLGVAITVPAVAELELYDKVTNLKAAERGRSDLFKVGNQSLYLNYTSVTGDSNSNRIDISISGTMPKSTKLKIVSQAPQLSDILQGTEDSVGVLAAGEILLGTDATDLKTTPIVTSIESAQTGRGAYGVEMNYSLVQKSGAKFTNYKSGTYNPLLTYTFAGI